MDKARKGGPKRARIEVSEILQEPLGEIAQALASSLSRLKHLPSTEVGRLLDVAEAQRESLAGCDVQFCISSTGDLVVDVAPHFPPLAKALIANIEERDLPAPLRVITGEGGLLPDERRYCGLINIRFGILRLVASAVGEVQSGFLKGSEKYLKPLTQTAIGEHTKLSVSTVSRAIKDKTVAWRGDVVPFEDLLSAPVGTEQSGPSKHEALGILRDLHQADSAGWLTDADLQQALEGRGIRVARRTVAKYRSELGLVSSQVKKRPGRLLPEELQRAVESFSARARSPQSQRLYRGILLRTLERAEVTSLSGLMESATAGDMPERIQAQLTHLMPSTQAFYEQVIGNFLQDLVGAYRDNGTNATSNSIQ